jgi:DNA-binding PadR family transcriptional regulator
MHGYELKQHLKMLTGHFRPVSDGALYPAISRLRKQGFIIQTQEAGIVAAPRHVLSLTSEGENELTQRLRELSENDISDRNRFFTVLSFLKFLDLPDQINLLERRLTFLEGGKSFFHTNGKPVTTAKEQDIFRRGMLLIARETSKVEKAWLKETILDLKEGV